MGKKKSKHPMLSRRGKTQEKRKSWWFISLLGNWGFGTLESKEK